MDSVDDFNRKVDDLKLKLVAGKRQDKNGRYKVSQEEFEQCIDKVFDAYKEEVTNNHEKLLKSSYNQYNCFTFKNLNTDFNSATTFKSIIEQCRSSNPWFNKTRNTPYFLFENCEFEYFQITGGWMQADLFTCIRLHKCTVHRADFSSEFFARLNSMPFHAVKTSFDSVKFSNTINESFSVAFCFAKCEFTNSLLFTHDCVFKESVEFYDCAFGSENEVFASDGIVFNNATFDNTMELVSCDFYVSPKFHNTKLHSDTTFYLSKFHDCKSTSSMGDYRALKVLMSDLGSDQDAVMFHALEMDSRRNSVLRKTLHREGAARLASIFLKNFNDYGRNFWSPFVCVAGVFSLFFVIYLCSNSLACNVSNFDSAEIWERGLCFNDHSEKIRDRVFASLSYSFNKSLGPLGVIFDSGLISAKYGWVKFIATIQVIISSIIWYLTIVQFRRQFKL